MTSDAARFFDAIAGRYERAYALSSKESRARMMRVLELLGAESRVLDLGVGTGRELTSLLDAGHTVVAVDASQGMLDRCAKRAPSDRLTFVQADFWAPLPFEDQGFDAAIALHGTLAHPPDEAAVRALCIELARVIRPGGLLIAEMPTVAWLDRLEASSADDRRVTRTGPRACLYEDLAAKVSIEARVLGEPEWRAALAPFEVTFEPISDVETRIVASASGKEPTPHR
jgi:ubiquinone/menaquinone biosynthesis C-methylase UbiE